MPAASPLAGAKALATFATASAARRFGWTNVLERANRPVVALSDMQPVTAAWWRERRTLPGEFHYLALGDSTGQGIGASTPGRSYVGQLAERIEEHLGAPIRVTNLCFSGATSYLCARDQLPRAAGPLAAAPDLVTLDIGANDIADWDPVAYHRHLRLILDALPAHTVLGEVPCFHLPWNERKVGEANRILHRIAADRGLAVVPIHAATRARGLAGVLTEFAEDAFHPNDRGYEIWAETFWPFVRARVDAVRGSAMRGEGHAVAAGHEAARAGDPASPV
ncbi:SGNH/GDSL hydrolase family protein [Leucobacter soli]|uniref:SGNH hydrolase-type esterase domain-containing protein n=1 Tax=Leucobacter soli TaxID=2812850 RepID=A0A916JW87_9MICO|nr:SGNH/GDSL hydrolase family protein [Leucobacter soli]CAG7605312.1 hypothetical protein LEUCIP111803_00817 [Leucobacter soli]